MNPFNKDQLFINNLEKSGCTNKESGWVPYHIKNEHGLLPSYLKFHSYGEYIFDWSWAEFYQKNNLQYYPKMLHMIPFTPCNSPKIIGKQNDYSLFNKSFEIYQDMPLSSEHYLFMNDDEEHFLQELGFHSRFSLQFHWENKWTSFDEFLSSLKKNRKKNIKKERNKVFSHDLKIITKSHEEINHKDIETFFTHYISTISKKNSYPYLNQDFFNRLIEDLSKNILLIQAIEKNEIIASALFLYSDEALYGRYWGISPYKENEFPFLHFELCYYQGMEFCIKNKIPLFEAGAQGEHKLLRGFKPVIIKSAHHLKHQQIHQLVGESLKEEKRHIEEQKKYLNQYLPYR